MKAILFDLDGTLLDTIEGISFAMNKAFSQKGLDTYSQDEYKIFVGSGLDKLIERAFKGSLTPELKEDFLRGFKKNYQQCWLEMSHIYPGINMLLDELKALDIKMAILSNKTHDFTLEMVAHFFPKKYFEIILGARPEVPKKPDITAVLEITKQMSLSANNFCYLGDTDVDMQTANKAGMYALGATWGFRSQEELLAHGAQQLIAYPTEILPLFRK